MIIVHPAMTLLDQIKLLSENLRLLSFVAHEIVEKKNVLFIVF